jgi:hypothetical protein
MLSVITGDGFRSIMLEPRWETRRTEVRLLGHQGRPQQPSSSTEGPIISLAKPLNKNDFTGEEATYLPRHPDQAWPYGSLRPC